MISFQTPTFLQDLSLLFVRIVLVVTFVYEAQVKLSDIHKFSKSHKVSVPIAYLVVFCEAMAALSMATGLMAQIAGLGIILLMCFTLYMHFTIWHSKYWAAKSGWEYDILMIVLAFVIVTFGAGNLSLDALM